jgi:uncharacterized phage protein (TIGR02220 family)
MMKIFWRELFPKKKQLELCIFLLGREGERISMNDLCSSLHIQRTSAYNLLKSLLELMNKHQVPLALGVLDGYVMMKRKVQSTQEEKPQVNAIITYLNEVTNKNFRIDSKVAVKVISARLKEGYKYDDFKYVIDIKASKWMNSEMEDYLRPETLFSTKFQSYLNERPQSKQFSKIEQSINAISTELDWGKGE